MKKENTSKVLIVSDKIYLRKQLRQILIKEGYSILGEGNDGHDAISLFRKHDPDILIMDADMSLLDGIEASDSITNRFKNAKILLIMDDLSKKSIAQRAGVMGFVRKPIDQMALTAEIKHVLKTNPKPKSKKDEKVTSSVKNQDIAKPIEETKPLRPTSKKNTAVKDGEMPTLGSLSRSADIERINAGSESKKEKKVKENVPKEVFAERKMNKSSETQSRADLLSRDLLSSKARKRKSTNTNSVANEDTKDKPIDKTEDLSLQDDKFDVPDIVDNVEVTEDVQEQSVIAWRLSILQSAKESKMEKETPKRECPYKVKSFDAIGLLKPIKKPKIVPKFSLKAYEEMFQFRPKKKDLPIAIQIKSFAQMQMFRPKIKEEDNNVEAEVASVIPIPIKSFNETLKFRPKINPIVEEIINSVPEEELEDIEFELDDIEFDIVPTSEDDEGEDELEAEVSSEEEEYDRFDKNDFSDDESLEDLDDIEFEIG